MVELREKLGEMEITEIKKLSFAEKFALSGCAAVISKTATAPIERIKLLIQNQDEMIKQVNLSFCPSTFGQNK